MNPETDELVDIEESLRQMFDQNFERLRAESGHTLSPELKQTAWEQVQMYWRRLREIAETVTDTEVKLNLPNQETPNKRKFSIEGVVDIVREANRTTMYDIKTHDLEYVNSHPAEYRKQLNVYAHIWQKLRGEQLDEMAIICTVLPDAIQKAMKRGDAEVAKALAEWNPVVPIEFDETQVNETVQEFGEVVDAIEDKEFAPKTVAQLRQKDGRKKTFGSGVCRNCDARYSCTSYREFAKAPGRRNAVDFLPFYDTLPTEEERQTWWENAFPGTQRPEEIGEDLQ